MTTGLRSFLSPAVLLAVVPFAHAQAPQTFTPKSIVQFAEGGDRERAMFSKLPGLAELVKGKFGVGAVDLNGNGSAELILLSLTCDNAGCPVVVFESKGPGNVRPIFAQKMTGRVAITNEAVNGYNALAAADPQGKIMTDARGKQVVFPLGGDGRAAANAPAASAAPAAPKPAAPAPAAAPAAKPAAAAQDGVAQANGEFLPLCLLPRCLNPRVLSKSGVGTANATAEAKVTAQDAAKWCAQYNPTYKGCVEDRVEGGGAADRFTNIDFKASANCEKGTLTAIDEKAYTYVGTWTDGRGAGRPRFKGPFTTDGTTTFEQQGAPQVESGAWSISDVANQPNSGESLAIQWEVLCGTKVPGR